MKKEQYMRKREIRIANQRTDVSQFKKDGEVQKKYYRCKHNRIGVEREKGLLKPFGL